MRLFRNGYNLRRVQHNAVVAIGSFDGLHLGHQAIVARVCALAKQMSAAATVVLFEPLPREVLHQGRVRRLYAFRERVAFLQTLHVDQVICLRFNASRAVQSAQAFIQDLLVTALGAQAVVVGGGFRFGHQRQGDSTLLKTQGEHYGFTTEVLSDVMVAGRKISSTWVREALASGDFALAERLLGRPYCIAGRVGHGEKQATSLGFPTANLLYGRYPPPLQGVYAGDLEGLGDTPWRCVINAGYRPMFAGDDYRLEVHVPQFSGELYGTHLRVRPLLKIRDEQKFDSLATLRQAIGNDIKASMEI